MAHVDASILHERKRRGSDYRLQHAFPVEIAPRLPYRRALPLHLQQEVAQQARTEGLRRLAPQYGVSYEAIR